MWRSRLLLIPRRQPIFYVIVGTAFSVGGAASILRTWLHWKADDAPELVIFINCFMVIAGSSSVVSSLTNPFFRVRGQSFAHSLSVMPPCALRIGPLHDLCGKLLELQLNYKIPWDEPLVSFQIHKGAPPLSVA
jgi:hypothetical protein